MEPKESRPFVFKFSDPRQQRIYEELNEIVGPGPASFFRDACWLRANPYQLQSTAHLVAHLLREIESALRDVFWSVAKEGAEDLEGSTSKKESAKKKIRAILRSLGIDEDSREARAWFALVDMLHKFAHRRGLDAPRSLREISELWDKSQTLLDFLLRSLREHFLAWIETLDNLLAKPKPDNDDLTRLAQKIPNNAVTRGYFFDRLENPEWLEPLWKKGFFRHPPAPVRDEEKGTPRFPPWPEARYLARMAPHKPDLVAEIIQKMDDTEDAAVISDLVDALLAMPSDISVQLLDKVTSWAKSPYMPSLLACKFGQLLALWAKGGKTEEALRVAQVLLDILPDEHRVRPGPEDAYRLPPEPRARFAIWDYERILKEHYPELVRQAGVAALQLLCDLLEKAVQSPLRHSDDKDSEDYSCLWRPAIEDHLQNHSHTIEDALVSAVRDAAELVVLSKKATIEEVVTALEERRWKVFKRIALHILRVFPDQGKFLAAARLTDRSLFEDVGLRHEYVLLLRARFLHLTPEEQAKILEWIEGGPDLDRWKQESRSGKAPSEEEVVLYREVWQRDWLARIGPDSLPTEWRERYRELVGKYGEPEHPEFPVYMKGVWIGPTSPKRADELKTMSVTEIVEFLRTWEPPENIFCEPSPEGLRRELWPVVAEDPGRFASEAPLFKGLDPTYVRALVLGLQEALRQNRRFDEYWEPVLELCQWVVLQPRDIPGRQVKKMEADPDWGWTRKAIADLLSAGLENRPGGIPIRLRQRVWDILKPLTDDPEPTPEYEQRYGGSNMDPATLSINTTRGEAMHAVVRYALWVRRHLEQEPDAQGRLAKGFEEMPEVREVLEAHLNPNRDPSLAIRAVYGQWFPWLVLLDSNWARAHAVKIFPQDSESAAYFDAAWNTYVIFCIPYDSVLEILRPFYLFAVERIGVRRDDTRWPEDPDKKLAEHLMAFYWRGKLLLDDPLLVRFWEKAPDDVRAHALAFVGQSLKQTEGDIPAEILERLKKLWEQRLAAAKKAQQPSDFEKEMAAFGWWFVSEKFDVDWAITQLSESLRFVRTSTLDFMVLEHLARTAPTHPRQSVECLRMIAEADQQGWNLYASRDHVRRILEVAMRDPSATDEAEKVIHYLSSRGFLEFRDLLERR